MWPRRWLSSDRHNDFRRVGRSHERSAGEVGFEFEGAGACEAASAGTCSVPLAAAGVIVITGVAVTHPNETAAAINAGARWFWDNAKDGPTFRYEPAPRSLPAFPNAPGLPRGIAPVGQAIAQQRAGYRADRIRRSGR